MAFGINLIYHTPLIVGVVMIFILLYFNYNFTIKKDKYLLFESYLDGINNNLKKLLKMMLFFFIVFSIGGVLLFYYLALASN